MPYGPFLAIQRAFCNKMSVGKCLVGKCQFDATEWFRRKIVVAQTQCSVCLFSFFNSLHVQNCSAADLQIWLFKGCRRPTEAMPNVLYHPTLLVMTPPNGPIHWTQPQRPLRPYHTRLSDYWKRMYFIIFDIITCMIGLFTLRSSWLVPLTTFWAQYCPHFAWSVCTKTVF